MKRLFALFFALSLGACSLSPQRPAVLNHVVLAWFKDSVSQAEIDAIRARSLELRAIPGILSIQAGRALPSRRPIVDDSFDLGLVMSFASESAMQAYLADPRHRQFVTRYVKDQVQRLVVYDIVAVQP